MTGRAGDRTAGGVDAIPAASLILMRDGAAGASPELLIVRRGDALRFAGGAYAFPGGRVDPADEALAEAIGEDDHADIAARIAALRELREETGLDLGAAGLTRDDLARLVPFARWRPRKNDLPRRFDTRFYIARAPADAAVAPDGGEIVALFWSTARAVVERHQAGDGRLLFPTRCLLERLATFASVDAAEAQARAIPAPLIEPAFIREDGVDWLTIPEGLGYPYWREPLDTATRS